MKLIYSYPLNQGKNSPGLRSSGERSRGFFKLKDVFQKHSFLIARIFFMAFLLFFFQRLVLAQSCPISGTHSQNSSENTYFYAPIGTLAAGSSSITLNAVPAGYGTTPIASGDQVLIIQMQGAEIVSTNTSKYGTGAGLAGSGDTSQNFLAGHMEYAIATSAVPLTGGVLTIASPTVNTYVNSAYGTYGQYTYQVIRVPSWYNIQLTALLSTPVWNGTVGGVTVISAVNQLDFNSQTISGAGAGFRGGAGRQLHGAAGLTKNDYMTYDSLNANGSKGEGIAGTPRYINNGGLAPFDNLVEGYPGGSYARGAPGNAGGGGTDGDPSSNDQNSGGGGGGNGGVGGQGGNGWSSGATSGGKGGSIFSAYTPYTTYYGPARLIMGGGGGAGTTNDGTGAPGSGFASSGASGGGMVLVTASTIINNGTIDVSGATGNNSTIIDGSGGGGAGGSVLIYAASGLSNITVTAVGGNGGSNDPAHVSATQHGPGGGGGGGVVYSNAALNAASSVAAGIAGISVSTTLSNNFGAGNGSVGSLVQNITLSQLPPNMETCQGSIILPINLLDFKAAYQSNNMVLVSWSASDEMNTSSFEVERSLDGINFTDLGSVSVNKSPGETHEYSFNDYLQSVNSSVLYYRLKMINFDGTFSYSKIAVVSLDQAELKFSVFPNPTTDYAVLRFSSDKQSVALMKLMDNSGREIMLKSFTVTNGNNSLMVDQLGNLPKGIYVIQVLVNNSLYNSKLVKQ
jgi:hypothetical protein